MGFGEVVTSIATGVASSGFSTIFGGITGILGGWLKNKHDVQLLVLQQEDKKLDHTHELAIMDKEADNAKAMATIHLEETMFEADAKALTASIADQSSVIDWASSIMNKTGPIMSAVIAAGLGFVTFVQKMVRPGLTIYLIILVHLLWVDLQSILKVEGVTLTVDQSNVLCLRIVDMILYLASTSVAWWFATRPKQTTL